MLFADIFAVLNNLSYIVTPEKPKHFPKTGTLEAIKGYNINQET